MKRKIELLAPGGDIDSIKAAIAAGADAVYCGLKRFNARNRAENIDLENLSGIIRLAHRNNCKVYLTINIIIVGSEIPALITLLNKLINTRIDGVIIQDFGLFYLISKYFKGLKIHGSTQLTTHNEGQIKFLNKLNASQINLSRELNINEIKDLASIGHKNNILIEIFVHGSYCISFSGICYISSVHGGNSGNRGRCSQPCRDRFISTEEGENYPLNLKDNSAYFNLKEISDAGVDSIKIEGRIKKFDYVYTVVNNWKKQILSFYNKKRLRNNNDDFYKVFNRNYSNSYLMGDINKDMFIDYPRDNSIKHLSEVTNYSSNEKRENDHIKLFKEKEEIKINIKNKIKQFRICKDPLTINISGEINTPLKISVITPDTSFTVYSETNLVKASIGNLNQGVDEKPAPQKNKTKRKNNTGCLNYNTLLSRFKALNNTVYFIDKFEIDNLQSDLFLSFKELTSIKKRILSLLDGPAEISDPIKVPFIIKQKKLKTKPDLGVLISSTKDLNLCNKTTAKIFYELPNSFKNNLSEYKELFLKNKNLTPWFPSVLIGENYTAAVDFMEQVKPDLVVTNNTGIAYEAWRNKIPWIAGPYLNIVNSFSLLCLKEKFNCFGSFISNEISKNQIKSIINPENFKLYYSIYHPLLLLTSRQCLFHQVTGCIKDRIDKKCIQECKKSSSITNLNNDSIYIKKTEGNYHKIYNNKNFLNTEIVTDLPGIFSGFFIDLRDIKTETKIEVDKIEMIKHFENLLNGNIDSKIEIEQIIYPTSNEQYQKGI